MPEGDTLFRTAATLRKALLTKTISRFDSSVDIVTEVHARRSVTRRTVEAVEARGKHLLIVFREAAPAEGSFPAAPISTPEAVNLDLIQTDLVLHTHLRMTGSWHIYRPNEPWQKPAHYAKVVLYTEDFVTPCFSAPVVELLTARETSRHPDLISLGPDAMTESFDPIAARTRLRRNADLPIGVALMNQRAMAGVGNVFKSEVMFIRRLCPFLPVSTLTDEALDALIAESHRLLRLNTNRGIRQTRFALNEREHHWVYGRSGQSCRVCGERIRMLRQGLDGRSTYFCPNCQGGPPQK